MKYFKVKARLIKYDIDPVKYERDLIKGVNEILKIIDIKAREGRNPYIFAVASVYAADQIISHQQKTPSILTQKILSKATNCAEYSIRDHWRGLLYGYIKKMKKES